MIPQLKIFKDQSPARIEELFNAWMLKRRAVVLSNFKGDTGISNERASELMGDCNNLPPPTTHLQYDSSLQAFIFTVVYLMYPHESNDVK
jgi:hypothetical protein